MNDSLIEKIKKLHLAGLLQTADMRAEQAAKGTAFIHRVSGTFVNDENLTAPEINGMI